jgi:PKD repeat protein
LAALILSLEPAYTATMVRNIIEHTAEKINPLNANYNGITGRSLRYGYGRIDAGAAVEATYDGFFWPERLADVCLGENCNPPVPANTIRWKINDDLRIVENVSTNGVKTISVLVVESDRPFSWAPTDGQEYSVGTQVANGVIVRANLLAEMFTFTQGAGTKYFGLYPVATTPRRGLTYGFGVAVDSLGTVIDSGTFLEPPDVVIPPENQRPRVTISVSPLAGESPLTVTFTGNAESVNPIESFLWDFGDGTTSSQRNTTHVYTVAAGTQRFFPVLTAIDVLGNSGSRSVAIDVSAPGQSGGGEQTATVRIRISAPGSPQSDIAAGQAPLPVVLNAEITGLATTPPGLTVAWDLGDGNTANGLSVAHTYRVPGTFPITVSVNLNDEDDTVLQTTRFVQVLAGTASPSPTATPSQTPDPNGNGGIGCGAGAIVAIWAMAMMALARRCMR